MLQGGTRMHKYEELGTFMIRVVTGLIFFTHGLAKFQGGIQNTTGFFENAGLPAYLAYFIGAVELVGGFSLLFGLGTKLFASAFAVIMVGAIITVKLKSGFVGGFEFDLAILVMSIHLFFNDKQIFAIDNHLVKK